MKPKKISKKQISNIEDILVDCYGFDEQLSAWEVTFTDNVKVPFKAKILSSDIEVKEIALERKFSSIQCLVEHEDFSDRWIDLSSLNKDSLPKDCLYYLELFEVWQNGA